MSTTALSVSHRAKAKFNRDYADALILGDDGTLHKFHHVDVLGFWDGSPLKKFSSFLCSTRRISLTMSPCQTHLELKAIVVECILNDGYWDDEGIDEARRYRIAPSTTDVLACGTCIRASPEPG